MASKALVIGLDCAAPQWVFDRWLDELPTIRSLTERGTFGILRSCEPPITVPAWSVMTSSRTPGSLGFYGFRNRRDHSYDAMAFADSRAVGVPRVWDLLSEAGRPVVVLGVPQTYPVSSVNGVMVSCFLTPDTQSSQYTYPAELKGEIEDLVGRYMVDVDNFRTEEKERLLEQIEEMTARRFRVAEHLLETKPWDLFFMVEMGTDRIHHAFWRFFDHEHRLYEPGNPFEQGVLDWVRYAPDARLTRSALGVPEPDGPRLGPDAIAAAGLMIVPALAIDQAGWRLGRGAGYFDRALAYAGGPICALVYADELLPVVPHEDHDVPVDLVVTEAGIFRVP